MAERRLDSTVWWIGVLAAIAVGVIGLGFAAAAAWGLVLAPAAPWILGAALAAGLPALAVRLVRERRARPRAGRLASVDRVLHLVLLVAGALLGVCGLGLLVPAPLQNLAVVGALGSGSFLLTLVPASVVITWLRAAAPRDVPAVPGGDRLVRTSLGLNAALAAAALTTGVLAPLAHLRP